MGALVLVLIITVCGLIGVVSYLFVRLDHTCERLSNLEWRTTRENEARSNDYYLLQTQLKEQKNKIEILEHHIMNRNQN